MCVCVYIAAGEEEKSRARTVHISEQAKMEAVNGALNLGRKS